VPRIPEVPTSGLVTAFVTFAGLLGLAIAVYQFCGAKFKTYRKTYLTPPWEWDAWDDFFHPPEKRKPKPPPFVIHESKFQGFMKYLQSQQYRQRRAKRVAPIIDVNGDIAGDYDSPKLSRSNLQAMAELKLKNKPGGLVQDFDLASLDGLEGLNNFDSDASSDLASTEGSTQFDLSQDDGTRSVSYSMSPRSPRVGATWMITDIDDATVYSESEVSASASRPRASSLSSSDTGSEHHDVSPLPQSEQMLTSPSTPHPLDIAPSPDDSSAASPTEQSLQEVAQAQPLMESEQSIDADVGADADSGSHDPELEQSFSLLVGSSDDEESVNFSVGSFGEDGDDFLRDLGPDLGSSVTSK